MRTKKISTWAVCFLLLWTGYFVLFWSRVLRWDAAGNLFAGNLNVWADWAIHFTFGSAMAYRQLVPASSPLLLGDTFSYPFAADLISALLHKAGMDFFWAFILPSCLFSILLAASAFAFLRALFRSNAIAILGSFIFLLGGGLGFAYFAREVAGSPAPLWALFNPVHEVTRVAGTPIVLLSIIDSVIIPQRSFTLGFPLALLALTLIHSAVQEPGWQQLRAMRWIKLVVASLILGLMPLIHAHSFLAVAIVLLSWALGDVVLRRDRPLLARIAPWAVVAVTTTVIALPLLLKFIVSRVGSEGFIRWYPGWYAKELSVNWLWFWFSNWSITPLLALVGFWMLARRRQDQGERLGAVCRYLPFLVLFALVNLFVFQPWLWDNTKLLAWAALGFSGLAAHVIVVMWTHRPLWLVIRRAENDYRGNMQIDLSRSIAGLLVLLMVASGAIDAYRIQRVDLHQNMMYAAEDFQLASWVRQNTPVESIWLTGDRHNHWLSNLTGRQTVMSYRGWLWPHGYDYRGVERYVSEMFTSAPPSLLDRYGIDYIVIGPDERQNWRANEDNFRQRFPAIIRTQSYTLFKVK